MNYMDKEGKVKGNFVKIDKLGHNRIQALEF
jgi:hypothetical protein